MNRNNLIEPSFEDAQKLSTSYSTIESKKVLYNELNNTLNPEYINSFKNLSIHEMYNHVLLRYYPNEVSIKSSFVNKVLLKGKTHVTIFELPIVNSRADLCKINGESIVYEIKTDLDTFSRLPKQIDDYSKIFDKTYVICSVNNQDKIKKHIPNSTGIYSYRITNTGKYIFRLEKKALDNKTIDSYSQLSVLNKIELSLITGSPSTNSKEDMIRHIISKNNTCLINSLFKSTLKNRYHHKWLFLKSNYTKIQEIDYQWFYRNTVNPELIYN
ncbi:MAG: sce7726 family protein [Clostridia bacterium]|nr:sce7726 family protein [Clostridia bacterium]